MKHLVRLTIIGMLITAICITVNTPSIAHAEVTKTNYEQYNDNELPINDATLNYIRYHVHIWLNLKPASGNIVSSTVLCRIDRNQIALDSIKYAIDDELAKDPLGLSTVYHTSFCIEPNNRMSFNICNICLFKHQWRYEHQVRQVINPILRETKNMTDEEKLTFFHDWICENTVYDYKATETLMTYDNSHAWTAYGAFIDKKAVCLGYARAFQILCLLSNIDCEIVYSNGTQWHGGHAYNLVHLNEEILYVDVCSDDGIIRYGHDHFLKTKKEMLDSSMGYIYKDAHETADMKNVSRYWKNYL